jgi:hypothetical protein
MYSDGHRVSELGAILDEALSGVKNITALYSDTYSEAGIDESHCGFSFNAEIEAAVKEIMSQLNVADELLKRNEAQQQSTFLEMIIKR